MILRSRYHRLRVEDRVVRLREPENTSQKLKGERIFPSPEFKFVILYGNYESGRLPDDLKLALLDLLAY